MFFMVPFIFYACIGNFNSSNENQQKVYTIIGQVYVRHYGGMPPATVDYIIAVKNSNCIRLYSELMFDSTTSYQPIVTDNRGHYEIKTIDSCIAIVLFSCAGQLQRVDTLRNMNYEKLHIINFEEENNDTTYFVDTLYYIEPS